MNTKIKTQIDAIDTTIAQLEAQLDLQEKVTKMLNYALPSSSAPDDWLGVALQFYRFGVEHILHDSLLSYTYETEFHERDRHEFFVYNLSDPLEVASDLADMEGRAN